MAINEAYAQLFDKDSAMLALPYDQCNLPAFIMDPELDVGEAMKLFADAGTHCLKVSSDCEKGTQWSAAWTTN